MMKQIPLKFMKMYYKIYVQHEVNLDTKEIDQKVFYELCRGDKVEVTDDPKKFYEFIAEYSLELLKIDKQLADYLKNHNMLVLYAGIPPYSPRYVILVKKYNLKTGIITDYELAGRLTNSTYIKQDTYKKQEGNKVIVGFWQENGINEVIAIEDIDEKEKEEAKNAIEGQLRALRVR